MMIKQQEKSWPRPASALPRIPQAVSKHAVRRGYCATVWVDILPKVWYLGYMSTRNEQDRLELLQGTLDLLILRTLIFGPEHGHGIARGIQRTTEDELLVEHGALYPALQRLEERGWIAAEWGTSTNNRKARFYRLTRLGRRQLVKETAKWRRLAAAIGRVLGSEAQEG
jgi:PadR family transcriptional regulator, regulatory protein PadR